VLGFFTIFIFVFRSCFSRILHYSDFYCHRICLFANIYQVFWTFSRFSFFLVFPTGPGVLFLKQLLGRRCPLSFLLKLSCISCYWLGIFFLSRSNNAVLVLPYPLGRIDWSKSKWISNIPGDYLIFYRPNHLSNFRAGFYWVGSVIVLVGEPEAKWNTERKAYSRRKKWKRKEKGYYHHPQWKWFLSGASEKVRRW